MVYLGIPKEADQAEFRRALIAILKDSTKEMERHLAEQKKGKGKAKKVIFDFDDPLSGQPDEDTDKGTKVGFHPDMEFHFKGPLEDGADMRDTLEKHGFDLPLKDDSAILQTGDEDTSLERKSGYQVRKFDPKSGQFVGKVAGKSGKPKTPADIAAEQSGDDTLRAQIQKVFDSSKLKPLGSE